MTISKLRLSRVGLQLSGECRRQIGRRTNDPFRISEDHPKSTTAAGYQGETSLVVYQAGQFYHYPGVVDYSEPAVDVLKVESGNYGWINSWGGFSIYEQQVTDYSSKVIPDALKELFYCINFSGWLENTPAIIVGPTDEIICSRIEHISPDSDKGRNLLETILKEWRIATHREDIEYEGGQFIDYLECYYVLQACFKDDGPMIFVVKRTSQGFDTYALYG